MTWCVISHKRKAEERFANEVIKKIDDLLATDVFSADNCVLMRVYVERLQDIFDRLNGSWDILIGSGDDDAVNEAEVVNSKIKIQEAISVAIMFVEKCNKSNEEITVLTSPDLRSSVRRATPSGSGISKLEKIKNPTFSGDIRTFSKFNSLT